jgi:hypothetical protein
MKTETRKSSAALKFQLLKFSGKVAVPLMLLAMALPATKSYAGRATWQLSPRNGDWNKAGNWMPRTVPNGEADIATLELSSTSEISVSDNTTVSGIVFNAGASPFTVAISPPRTLSLTGVGITNDSGILQNFVADTDTNGNRGIVSFFNTATAGSLTVFTNNGSIGGSQDGGHTEFHDASSAGSGTFISNAASFNGFLGGQTEFHDSSSASNGVFIANGGEFNGGMTQFFDFANAADGSFTTNGGSVDGGSTFFSAGRVPVAVRSQPMAQVLAVVTVVKLSFTVLPRPTMEHSSSMAAQPRARTAGNWISWTPRLPITLQSLSTVGMVAQVRVVALAMTRMAAPRVCKSSAAGCYSL